MPRRKNVTDSDSSSDSETESDGYQSDNESKLIRKYNRKHGERRNVGKSNRAKHGSSYLRLTTQGVDQFASTPSSIFDELCARYAKPLKVKGGRLFDPCPEFYKDGKRINKPDYNGLEQDWGKVSYVNPPYGQIKLWFPKAIEQQKKGNTSIFLVPLRPFTQYFLQTIKSISWIEVIYYGVGFKGYAGKIPHPMCTICFLGKGVKDRPEFHMTHPQDKKTHVFQGPKSLTERVHSRRHTYVQRVPKPCAFDNATEICENHGIPKSRIHIMINSSNMVDAGYLDEAKMAKAKTSWKHAYALLVPFYNYSVAFQRGMRDATVLAYSSPILCNYAGEGKCRFCSVLFIFCPGGNDKRFKKLVGEPNLHPFKMYFNYNGYLPTVEELTAAKMKKIQASKKQHMSKQRGVMKKQGRSLAGGKVTSNRKSSAKKAKKPAKKAPAKRAKSAAKRSKSAKKPAKKAPRKKAASKTASRKAAPPAEADSWKAISALPKEAQHYIRVRWAAHFLNKHGKLPTFAAMRAQISSTRKQYKKAVFVHLQQGKGQNIGGNKRKADSELEGSRAAKKRRVMPTAGGSPMLQRSG